MTINVERAHVKGEISTSIIDEVSELSAMSVELLLFQTVSSVLCILLYTSHPYCRPYRPENVWIRNERSVGFAPLDNT